MNNNDNDPTAGDLGFVKIEVNQPGGVFTYVIELTQGTNAEIREAVAAALQMVVQAFAPPPF